MLSLWCSCSPLLPLQTRGQEASCYSHWVSASMAYHGQLYSYSACNAQISCLISTSARAYSACGGQQNQVKQASNWQWLTLGVASSCVITISFSANVYIVVHISNKLNRSTIYHAHKFVVERVKLLVVCCLWPGSVHNGFIPVFTLMPLCTALLLPSSLYPGILSCSPRFAMRSQWP